MMTPNQVITSIHLCACSACVRVPACLPARFGWARACVRACVLVCLFSRPCVLLRACVRACVSACVQNNTRKRCPGQLAPAAKEPAGIPPHQTLAHPLLWPCVYFECIQPKLLLRCNPSRCLFCRHASLPVCMWTPGRSADRRRRAHTNTHKDTHTHTHTYTRARSTL